MDKTTLANNITCFIFSSSIQVCLQVNINGKSNGIS